ncbi:MAG: hypothetical protein KBA51_07185 [Kiritimatiellae bacterium]|nr:hypothetical protein [Kiritimatiellia bacterium]
MSANHDPCCPKFDPAPWDEKEVRWQEKRFVKDRVTSFLHVPLNFGAVMKRNMTRIEAAGAASAGNLILSDENSLWGADVYIEVAKDVPGANMATISGTFLCKVFEGPYQNMRQWIGEMKDFVQRKGKVAQHMYFFYTTCPRCAKLYGKNYVVILARI